MLTDPVEHSLPTPFCVEIPDVFPGRCWAQGLRAWITDEALMDLVGVCSTPHGEILCV